MWIRSNVDVHSNKAVAEGAVSFFLEHFVSTRVAKYTYGTKCVWDYDASDPEHFIRRGKITTRPSGDVCVRDGYSAILKKVVSAFPHVFRTKVDKSTAGN